MAQRESSRRVVRHAGTPESRAERGCAGCGAGRTEEGKSAGMKAGRPLLSEKRPGGVPPRSLNGGESRGVAPGTPKNTLLGSDEGARSGRGTLYMIPCPIGEGGDPYDVLPLRNREVIRSLDYFIVENTRSARRFLSRAGIGKPIDTLEFAELNEHTAPAETEQLIRPLLAGRSAGMISEAGLPGVADPGADIAALCHRHGIRVVPMVGPSSLMLALMASGLNGQSFAFNGYLPVKPPERGKAIRFYEHRAHAERQSQIFIEAPYRNLKLFAELLSVCQPDTKLTVAADLLEPTEFIRTASVREWRTAPGPDINKRPAIFILG